MTRNPACSIYVGNLDSKVTERVLYEVLIQAGPIVDLHLPMDTETKKHKGFAFAEYETEENALYAIKLFSGIVCLNKKTLKFAMSGQDKAPQNTGLMNSPTIPKPHTANGQNIDIAHRSDNSLVNCKESFGNTPLSNIDITRRGDQSLVYCNDSFASSSLSPIFPQVYSSGLVYRGPYSGSAPASSLGGFVNNGLVVNGNYEYDRRVFGSMLNSVSNQGPRQPIAYPSY